MVVRNCLKLLSELSEIEHHINEQKKKLANEGVKIDLDEILTKHIEKQFNLIKGS